MLLSLDEHSFKEKILTSPAPAVIIFKAAWSGSWQILTRSVEQLNEMYHPTVRFFTVDIEEQPELTLEYNIYQIPTFMFFERGELLDYHPGILSEVEIKLKLRQFSPSAIR